MIEEPVKYITKVEIQGLWGRYDIEWNLHPDVNVLAGINGSGKTTILNRVYNTILRHSIAKDDIKKIENLSLTFDNKAVIFKTERSSFYACLFGIKLDIVSTFDTELNLYNADIKKRSDEKIKTELDLKIFDLQKEYLNYQVNLGKKLKANKGHPDDNSTYFQDRFLEIIDELFSETGKRVNRDKNEVEFLLGDKEINVYQLSSGEKQLLVILLTVLVQDNKPSILLMDEPEISLHIEWQRKLIKYIRELNPNVQIIIATHSPDIIMDGWLDKVFNLQDLIVKDSTVL